jgi:leucyl-tRNA synthetase
MDDSFFDFVLYGKGQGTDQMKKMRESFLYWYPVDSRHSAGDLIRNHLTLYIFIHTALMEKKLWPRQIATNGFVLMDGMKMSKSMGNILPLRKAIAEYGADVVRFSVVAGAELSSDTDFNQSVAAGVKSRLEQLSKLVDEAASSTEKKDHSRLEKWVDSRLNRHILNGSKLYSELAMRELALEIFYDVFADLQWYLKRSKHPNLKEFFKKWSLLICPIMPHFAEEFYHKLGGSGFATYSKMPEINEDGIDREVEMGEDLIKNVHTDIEKISGLIGKKPTKVTLLVCADWKRKLYEIARKEKSFESTLKVSSAAGIPMKDAPTVVKQLMKNVHALGDILSAEAEISALTDAKDFLSSEFGGCFIEVISEEKSTHQKAKLAMPNKPAIVLE